jgi:hypothetical protein
MIAQQSASILKIDMSSWIIEQGKDI